MVSVNGTEGSAAVSLRDLAAGSYFIKVGGIGNLTRYSSGYSLVIDADGGASPLQVSESQPSGPSVVLAADGDDLLAAEAAGLVATGLGNWSAVLGGVSLPTLNIVLADLADSYLGYATVTAYDADGNPLEGTITLDRDANGQGWFVDRTPDDNSEFDTAIRPYALGATLGSAACGHYDMLTFITHEIGHILGFGRQNPEFTGHTVKTADGTWLFVGDDFATELTADREHLAAAGDLMSSTLSLSQRRLPSLLDTTVLSETIGTV